MEWPHQSTGPGAGGSSDSRTVVWNFPGLDQDTFYASAFYVNKTQRTLAAPSPQGIPVTEEVTQIFLDRLADCFAWTKRPEETAEHVTATTIIRDAHEPKITVFIAKNVLHPPLESDFAEDFFAWLNLSVGEGPGRATADLRFWHLLVRSSKLRLEHYIAQISEVSTNTGREQADWYLTNKVIRLCRNYSCRSGTSMRQLRQLSSCAKTALDARRDPFFRSLRNEQSYRREQNTFRDQFPAHAFEDTPEEKLLQAIDFLARLRSGYEYFLKFRETERGTRFEYKIICQEQVEWNGAACKAKMGTFQYLPQCGMVESFIDDAIAKYGEKGSVHCEIQILCHFIQNGIGLPDYIGCSKKACALCQHMLAACGVHANGQHNFIYPRWSLPQIDFKDRTHLIGVGLMSAQSSMLSVIQESIRAGKTPGRDKGVMHTSARVTRRVSFCLEDKAMGGLTQHESMNHGAKVYTSRGRRSKGSVPAIHFAAHRGARPQVVRIHLYEPDRDDILEYWMFPIHYDDIEDFEDMESFENTGLVTAVQLNNKFIPGNAACTLREFSKCQWTNTDIYSYRQDWIVMFRISPDLDENWCFWDMMVGNEQKLRFSPSNGGILGARELIRGDIFIFPSKGFRVLDVSFNLENVLQKFKWIIGMEAVENWHRLIARRWERVRGNQKRGGDVQHESEEAKRSSGET